MTISGETKRLGRAASAGALGLVVLALCAQGSARAQEDNSPSIWNLDQRLWNGFMSAMGLKNGTEVGIDYRERSPLVVPPQRNLPTPEANPAAARNAAWPVDPDAKRRQEAATSKPRSVRGFDPDYWGRNLTPSELNPPGTRGGTGSTNASSGTGTNGESLLPSQLGYFGGLFTAQGFGFGIIKPDVEVGTFTNEPPRTSLTAPPVGYQTPSVAQPYGVTKRAEPYKIQKIEDYQDVK